MSGPDIEATWNIEVGTPPNIGIVTGNDSGIFVSDFDTKQDGLGSMKRMITDGLIAPTRTIKTGSGGFHAYYQMPEVNVTNSNAGLKAAGYTGVDVRGNGGYVVAPPSLTSHKINGIDTLDPAPYTVVRDVEVAPPAVRLLPALDRPKKERQLPPEAVVLNDQQRAYFERGAERELERLGRMAAMATPRGEGYLGEPWDQTTFEIGCNLMEIGNMLGLDYRDRFLEAAPRDGNFTTYVVEAKWEQAVKTIGVKGRDLPPAMEPDADNPFAELAGTTMQVHEPAKAEDLDDDELAKARDLAFAMDVAKEKYRLTVRDEAVRQVRDEGLPTIEETIADRVVGGAELEDRMSDIPEPIWGSGDQVIWARGEALLVSASTGVGKTTLAGLLLRGMLVGGDVLGMPVVPYDKVLYLAMDRPGQAARALLRQIANVDKTVRSAKMRLWKGGLPRDITENPDLIATMVREIFGDTTGMRVAVMVDSLKDAVSGLTDDMLAARYNIARQQTLLAGIDMLELHHQVKRNSQGGDPTSIEDVYGSTWVTAGVGSCIVLGGRGGDPIVRFLHLKQSVGEVAPFDIAVDHTLGRMSRHFETDYLAEIRHRKQGITAREMAEEVMFSTKKATPAEVEKAKRELVRRTARGQLYQHDGAAHVKSDPTRWTYLHQFEGDFDILGVENRKLPCNICGEAIPAGDDGRYDHKIDGGRGTPNGNESPVSGDNPVEF